jgi:hypothetical protein
MSVFQCSLYQFTLALSRQISNKLDCFIKLMNRRKCVIIGGLFDIVLDIIYKVNKNVLVYRQLLFVHLSVV